jgi:catechol 2,3-dioxygenase-like lactoylglutathione lyase family enzyme
MPRLTGPSHIDLTVTDVERSAKWWETVMGFTRINSFEQETFRGCGLWHRSGFTVTVLSHDATTGDSFDEKRVGLDHFAFAVADVAELDAWVGHLDGLAWSARRSVEEPSSFRGEVELVLMMGVAPHEPCVDQLAAERRVTARPFRLGQDLQEGADVGVRVKRVVVGRHGHPRFE